MPFSEFFSCLLTDLATDIHVEIDSAVWDQHFNDAYADRRSAQNSAAFLRACDTIGPSSLWEVLNALRHHKRALDTLSTEHGDNLDQQVIGLFSFFSAFGDWYNTPIRHQSAPPICAYFDSLYAITRFAALEHFGDWQSRGNWSEGILELLMVRRNCCECNGKCPARANRIIEKDVEFIALTDDVLDIDPDQPHVDVMVGAEPIGATLCAGEGGDAVPMHMSDEMLMQCATAAAGTAVGAKLLETVRNRVAMRDDSYRGLALQRLARAKNAVIARGNAVLDSLFLTLAWRTKKHADALIENPDDDSDPPISALFRRDEDGRVEPPDPAAYPPTLWDIGRFMTPVGETAWMDHWQLAHGPGPMQFKIVR